MVLTIKQREWLYNVDSDEYWHYYKIKDKIRDAYILLDTVVNSPRVDEFIDEIIPFIRILGEVIDKIPFDIIACEILSKISDNTDES